MSFPLVYSFIEGAFQDESDFFKNPFRQNSLVDDCFQSRMEMSKRQKLMQRATAWLDTVEASFDKPGFSPVQRKQQKANKTAYQID